MKRFKVSVLGTGKLGLCLALNLETAGNQVTCYDINSDYIKSLKNKTFKSLEPKVNRLLKLSRDILFTTDIEKALENDIVFIVVNTPSFKSGEYDHSNINSCLNEIKKRGNQKYRKDIVINCTTSPGYCESVARDLKKNNCYVSYNPEFISQGNIIEDQKNADFIIIGQADKKVGDEIEYLNKCFNKTNPTVHRMTTTEAELVKLSINCFLTTKISYANTIGDLALKTNCRPNVVLNAVGSDSRIGKKYLKYGFGYGGPCFPRDNKALTYYAMQNKINTELFKATDNANEDHLKNQIDYYKKNNPDKTKPVDIDFISYNEKSFSLEESHQFKFSLDLIKNGYKIKLKDQRPEILNQIKDIENFT